MADNVRSSIGTQDGSVFATDADDAQTPSVHYPIQKLVFGALNTFTLVTASAGLPVQQQSGATWAFNVSQYGGTAVGAANAIHVQPGTGATWAVTQSGNWSVRAQDGNGNVLTSAARGSERALSVQIVDSSGAQITSFGASNTYGAAFPSTGTPVGFSDGTNLQGARVFDADSGAGTQYVLGVNLRLAGSGGSVEFGTSTNPIRTDPTGSTTQPVSGTVTANAGTGTFTVDSELPAAAALADAASAAPTTPTVGAIPLVMNATTVDRVRAVVNGLDSAGTGIQAVGIVGQFDDTGTGAVTENQFAPVRISTRRALLVEGVASGTAVTVSGTVTANAGTGTFTVDTELPAAAALADAASATPTTPTVGAVPLLMNATTVDRARAVVNALDSTGTGIAACGLVAQFDDTSPGSVTENQFSTLRMSTRRVLYVEGHLADGAADTGNALKVGGIARNPDSMPADETAGDRIAMQTDLKGRQIVYLGTKLDTTNDGVFVVGDVAHDAADGTSKPIKLGAKAISAAPTAVAANDRTDVYATLSGALNVTPSSPGASETKMIVVDVAATSATRQTLLTPTAGKKVRVLSVQVVTRGLTTNPDRVGVYFGAGAAYTTTAANAIAEFVPGTTGMQSMAWPDGAGPVGAADAVVSGITETETETQLRYTIVYREE